MPRFTAILETRLLPWCLHLRRHGVLSTVRHLTVQVLRELSNTQEFDPPPSIGPHTARYLIELNQPHTIAVVSLDGNGEIGFHLFYADPSCYSTWEMASHLPGPRHPVKELGPDQDILLLSDVYSEEYQTVYAYQYLYCSIYPYSVLQPGGRVMGKHASGHFEIAIVTDDWKMHRYYAASSGTDPSIILHDTETLQGVGKLARANVFRSSDALLECSEPGKETGLIWAYKFPFIVGSAVRYSPFSFYPQGIASPLGSEPLLGDRYRMFTWPGLGEGSGGFSSWARLVVTGADSFLRIYYYPGTGSRWTLLKFDNGTQLADLYLGPSALYPWDVIAFSSGSQEFDGRGDLWLVGVAPGPNGRYRTVKIFRITPYIDFGRYTVKEDKTYSREEEVADVMWYRGSRRLIHLELERTGKLRIVLD